MSCKLGLRSLIFLMIVLLNGCGSFRMVNYSNPNANFRVDDAACQNDAATRVPNVAPQPSTAPTMYTTNCSRYGNSMDCTTTGGDNTAGARNALAQMQTNNNRNDYVANCLTMKGWVRERVN